MPLIDPDPPELTGSRPTGPFPRWRLAAVAGLAGAAGAFFSFMLWKQPLPLSLPGLEGFLFLPWPTPGLLGLAGAAWAIRTWAQAERRRTAFRGGMVILGFQLLGIGLWSQMRHAQHQLSGIYDSRIEYVWAGSRPPDWPDPAHPGIYDVGAGLRLALSPAVWTDALHRSLPRTSPPALEPHPASGDPHPLDDLGRRNLCVLMRACALVRFFHPADAAQFNDWGRLISQGVRHVEDAPTPEVLAARLNALLAPFAPGVRLLLPGEPVPVLSVPKGAVLVAQWRHSGVGWEALKQTFTGATKDRSARIAGVGMAWGTARHFYPCFEVLPVDWDAALPIILSEAAQAGSQADYIRILRRMLVPLKDGHAWAYDLSAPRVLYPQARVEALNGRPFLAQVWGQEQQLPLGAEILAVDGEPGPLRLDRMSLDLPASRKPLQEDIAAERFFMGEPGRVFQVDLRDAAGRLSHLAVQAHAPWQAGRPCPAPISEPRPGVFLVDLNRVDQAAFQDALPRLATARGIIFDLREYCLQREFLRHFRPGTLPGIRMFVPVTRQPYGLGRTWEEHHDATRSTAPYYQGRVVVLAGPSTMSFAETCLEIIAVNRLAPIVGATSAGAEGDILAFWLPGSVRCQFSGMRVLNQDGSQLQCLGIPPTIPVAHTPLGLAAGRDEDLMRALAYVASGR